MKQLLFFIMCMGLLATAEAQLKAKAICPPMEIDILDGKVNGFKADVTINEIKNRFPCFSSVEEEVSTSKCGGQVFYKDRDIYFFTGRDYIEVREKFKGKLSLPLLGAKKGSLFKWLGHPKMKDDKWEAFQTAYGTLVLYYGADNKVKKFQFSTKTTDALSLCD